MRKRCVVALGLAVMITGHAFAAPKPEAAARLGEQAKLAGEMKSLAEEYKALEADEKIQVQRNKDLSWGAEQYKRKLGDFESAGRKFDADAATYDRNLADHNRRCAGTFESQSHVDACNAAARAGAATKAELVQRGAYLNATGKQLDELRRVTSEESLKVFAKHKANVVRMDEVARRHDALLDRLNQIRGEVKKCKDAISSSTPEEMHDVCGEMFDGNK